MRQVLTSLFFFIVVVSIQAQNPVTILMCAAGQASSTTAPNGTVYDSGGPQNYYQNNEYCTLLIEPNCAVNLKLIVTEFSVEFCCDPLMVYDGESENAPFLGDVRFASIPATYTSTSGKLFLRWSSDGSATGPGFRAVWQSTAVALQAPEASFVVSAASPAFNETVHFEGSATNYPEQWFWDFGDGETSTVQNPNHTYTQSGAYTARLIVTNCHQLKDTVTQDITVQEPPAPAITPASLAVEALCGETTHTSFTVRNDGAGDLIFSLRPEAEMGRRKVLVYQFYANSASLQGVYDALANYPTMFEVYGTNASDSAALAQALTGMDLLVVPEIPNWIDPWTLMAQAPAVRHFVENGGGLVVCGSYYYNHFISATGLIQAQGNSFVTTDVSYNGLLFETPHPITQDMPFLFYGPYLSGALAFSDPAYSSLCTFNSQSVVGHKSYGDGRVVYLGFNYQSPDQDLTRLMRNALRWANLSDALIVSPQSGRVAPGDSINVEVTVNTAGVTAGVYAGKINCSVNNGASPDLVVPVSITVNGQAIVTPESDSIGFPDLMQLRETATTFVIENSGCDTLYLTDISTTNTVFSTNKTALTIDPFGSDTIELTFAPIDTGHYQETLVLTSPEGATTIALTGTAFGAPETHFNPLSLSATLSCGDSTELTIQVANTGIGALNLIQKFNGDSTGGTRVLIMSDLAYYYHIPIQIESWLRAAQPNVQVQQYYPNGNFADLPNLLALSDIVILPAIGNGQYSWYLELAPMLKEFAISGGFVLATGTQYHNLLDALDLVDINPNTYYGYGQRIQVLQDHPLVEMIDQTQLIYDDCWGHAFSSPDFVKVAKSESISEEFPIVGYQKVGGGTFAYIGYECDYGQDIVVKLVQNAFIWGGRPNWVKAIPDELEVAPGDTAEVLVKLNAAGYPAGTYTYNLVWTSNDPVDSENLVPITLTIEGDPQLEVAVNNLNFGVNQQFSKKVLKVPFKNAGCDTLLIQSYNSTQPAFSEAATNPTVIGPFETVMLSFQFNPQTVGALTGSIEIQTNGGVHTISMSGLSIGAPVVTATPANIDLTLSCNDTLQQSVLLSNLGLGALNYQFGSSNPQGKVAVFSLGAYQWRLNNILTQMNLYFPNLEYTTLGSLAPQDFTDSLNSADILLVPSLEVSGHDFYDDYRPIIQNFIQNGGIVWVIGVYYHQPLTQLGLFSTLDLYSHSYQQVTNTLPGHPVMSGFDQNFTINDNFVTADFISADKVVKLLKTSNDNHTYLGLRNVGKGSILFWGNNFENAPQGQLITLFENMGAWTETPLPPGVLLNPVNGMIATNDEQNLSFSTNGVGVPAGTYAGFIRIRSNDPVHPSLQIPISVTVTPQPCITFSVERENCSKTVVFTDETVNTLSSWYWQFGDGGESFQQNPAHSYTSGGTYSVSLIGCNNFGCDTALQQVVVPNIQGPAPINCLPQTLSYCCQTGIAEVHLASLNHLSPDASEGYQDYSCNKGTLLAAGEQYPISIITGSAYNENVRVWIDFNNNSVFNGNELVFTGYNYINHQGFITIPISAVKNVRLRMRISSDANSVPVACGDVSNGQVEDYYVEIRTSVATNEPDETLGVTLFPNPGSGQVWMRIQAPSEETCQVQVSDASGKTVWTGVVQASETALPLPKLSAGTYFVKVQSSDLVKVERLIVIN
ncbi:MAG: PKD domain-containing protein [Saprospiraceae bacterium]|nr:PKD domain-containing protein [Saprospiraceae bacterium]